MNKKNRPLIVHVTIAPANLLWFVGQSEFVEGRGFAMEAVTSPGPGLREFVAREGIAVHSVAMSRTITPLRDLVSLYRLWRLLRRLGPAVVDAHTPKGGILGMVAARLAGVPVRVYHIHGLPVLMAGGFKKALLRWSDRIAGGLAHRVLCVSPSIRRAALDERLFRAEKVRVLAGGTISGVDAELRFNPALVGPEGRSRVRASLGIPAEARVIGFVGRVVRDKGVVELAMAWQELRRRYPDTHLVVVGPFESKDAVPSDVKEGLAGDPRVHLVASWVDDPRPYYAAMDVLTLPSYREGFPYALLEASAMGLPVVGTTVLGCVDAVVDGETGRLVPPFDAPALTGALACYMDDPSLARTHGAAGRERVVREFGQRPVWEALFSEYEELLRSRTGAAQDPEARGGS